MKTSDPLAMQRKFTRMMLWVYYHYCYDSVNPWRGHQTLADWQVGMAAIDLLARVARLHPNPAPRSPMEVVQRIRQEEEGEE